jgi:hypothetical protein
MLFAGVAILGTHFRTILGMGFFFGLVNFFGLHRLALSFGLDGCNNFLHVVARHLELRSSVVIFMVSLV